MKKINIKGPIISNDDAWFYDYLELDGTCPKSIIEALNDSTEDVEITVNSYGGLVDAGNEIYTSLKSYPGNVTVNVIMAGSAASIIAMAGDVIKISPVGQLMIHNVSMGAGGDFHDMDKASEILQKMNDSLANAYVLKTGKTKEEILELMDKETWLTADEAKENGFVDDILFQEEKVALIADLGSGMVPKKIIDEMKLLKEKAVMLDNEQKIKQLKNEKEKPVDSSPFARFLF